MAVGPDPLSFAMPQPSAPLGCALLAVAIGAALGGVAVPPLLAIDYRRG